MHTCMLIHSYKRNKQEEATLLLKDQKSYAAEHHLEDDKSGFYQVDGRPHDHKLFFFFVNYLCLCVCLHACLCNTRPVLTHPSNIKDYMTLIMYTCINIRMYMYKHTYIHT